MDKEGLGLDQQDDRVVGPLGKGTEKARVLGDLPPLDQRLGVPGTACWGRLGTIARSRPTTGRPGREEGLHEVTSTTHRSGQGEGRGKLLPSGQADSSQCYYHWEGWFSVEISLELLSSTVASRCKENVVTSRLAY